MKAYNHLYLGPANFVGDLEKDWLILVSSCIIIVLTEYYYYELLAELVLLAYYNYPAHMRKG